MMKGKRDYKESGVEWVGEIPSNWRVIKLKHLSPVKRGASPRPIDDPKYFDENGEFAWVRIADVSASKRYLETTTERLSELGASLSVKRYPGDFFVSIAGSVGKPVISKIKCCIHDGFVYFPELKINPEFLFYIFETGLPFQGLGKVGTQLNLNTESIGNIFIPYPSDSEIDKILTFLDHQTGLIDALIAKKETLIEKLKLQRQAIINEAVTKGLDPNAKFKDSGIEWLGEIPEEWEVVKLSYVTSKIGDGLHSTPNYTDDEDYYFVNGNNLVDGKVVLSEKTRTVDQKEFERLWIEINGSTLLLSINGTIGNIGLYNGEKIILGKSACYINCNDELKREFLKYLFISQPYKVYFEHEVTGTTIYNLSLESIRNCKVVLPPLKDQDTVINNLDRENEKFNKIQESLKLQIEKLKLYRQSLISEAVTGKIDVREWEPTVQNKRI